MTIQKPLPLLCLLGVTCPRQTLTGAQGGVRLGRCTWLYLEVRMWPSFSPTPCPWVTVTVRCSTESFLFLVLVKYRDDCHPLQEGGTSLLQVTCPRIPCSLLRALQRNKTQPGHPRACKMAACAWVVNWFFGVLPCLDFAISSHQIKTKAGWKWAVKCWCPEARMEVPCGQVA